MSNTGSVGCMIAAQLHECQCDSFQLGPNPPSMPHPPPHTDYSIFSITYLLKDVPMVGKVLKCQDVCNDQKYCKEDNSIFHTVTHTPLYFCRNPYKTETS